MPRVAPDIAQYVTTGQIARVAGVSERVMTGRKSDGRLPVGPDGMVDLHQVIRAGIAALAVQQKAAAGGGLLDLTAERARLAKEQADATAMKNEVARGELLPAGEVTEAMRKAFAACRARLLAIPAKMAPLVADTSSRSECRDILTDAVNQACDELADARVEPALADQAGERGGDSEGVSDLEESAEVDGQPMGRRGKGVEPGG